MRGDSEIILKERQLGFSAVLVAPYLLWRAMFHQWVCGYLSVEQFGVFLDIGAEKPGLIHVRELTADRVEHANEVVKVVTV